MPEGLEVEIYRRAALPLVGRRIDRMELDERIAGPGVVEAASQVDGPILGRRVTSVGRVGKLLLIGIGHGDHTLGVHFGMTGRIVVNGTAPIERLEYGARRDDPAWDRLTMTLDRECSLRLNDPRRLGRVTLDPDTAVLGPDLFDLGVGDLRQAVSGRSRPLKAVLLDQASIAGLGNLCVDEVLWHAGLAPGRPAGELDDADVLALHHALRERLPLLLEAGGSHQGVVSPEVRATLPPCPSDGAPLRRDTIAGRTTVWCELHQV